MSLTQNRPPTRPAVGPNRSLVPRLLAALVFRLTKDCHVPMRANSLSIGRNPVLVDVRRGRRLADRFMIGGLGIDWWIGQRWVGWQWLPMGKS